MALDLDLNSRDLGLGPQDHSSLVGESLALGSVTLAKRFGLALETFCQGLGLKFSRQKP